MPLLDVSGYSHGPVSEGRVVEAFYIGIKAVEIAVKDYPLLHAVLLLFVMADSAGRNICSIILYTTGGGVARGKNKIPLCD
jgi:hypothetical protein